MILRRTRANQQSTRRTQRGAVIPILAGGAAALIAATAFTIDLGRLMIRNREMQDIADIAAIEGARLIDGHTVAELRPSVLTAVDEAAQRNGEEGASFVVQFGTYDEYHREFIEATSDSDIPNAIRVNPTDDVDFVFAPGSRTAGRDAVALQPAVPPDPPPPPCLPPDPACPPPPPGCVPPDPACTPQYVVPPPTAGFRLGSFLIGLDSNDSETLNAILGGLPGSPSFSFNAVGWQGLGAARVNTDALAAQLGFATPYDLANGSVVVEDLIAAMAAVGEMDGDSWAHLNNIAASITTGTTIDMGDLMLVTTGGNSVAAISDLNVAGLLTGSAILTDGDHAITVPGLSFGLPGVTTTQLELTFIEKPQYAFGEVGVTTAETRQATLTVRTTVDIPLVPPLGVTSVSLRGDVIVVVNNVPPPNGVAGATATLSAIACTGTEGIILDVATRAIGSAATVTAGLVAEMPFPLPDVNEPIGLTGSLVSPASTDQMDFVYPSQFYMDPYWFGPKPFGKPAKTLGLGALQLSYTDGIASPELLPLTNTVTDAVLEPLLGQIDSEVVASISSLLGLGFAGADLWAESMNCYDPVLVPTNP